MEQQYAPCDCEICNRLNLSADKPKDFSKVEKAGLEAFKKLHERGSYNPKDLSRVKEYKALVSETSNAFSFAISQDVPDELKAYLEKDGFIFSGLKTHAQLAEARSLLKDKDGNITPYYQFEQAILKLNEKYNRHYLEAEYEFAVQSSQSAANWANLQTNTARYWLEYRTAGDERVRASHAALNSTCLPADDDFWNSYYPPNGWRCRCVAVEVLARDYKLSDSAEAIKKGEKATTQIGKSGKNTLEMFRFNPGKEMKLFPPKNAYTKVVGADKVNQAKPENMFIPDKLSDYEKEFGISVNREIFGLLKQDVPLHFTRPDGHKTTGAFYHNRDNYIVIPLDERRRKSRWKAESVVYHEYGHAADWHNNLKDMKSVADVMKKAKKQIDFPAVDKRLRDLGYWAFSKGKFDLMEKVGGAHDTLMSLNPKYGMGHSASYWKIPGNKEAEFLAHAFENRFSGNEVFKKVMPELYDETIKLIDSFMPKQESQ